MGGNVVAVGFGAIDEHAARVTPAAATRTIAAHICRRAKSIVVAANYEYESVTRLKLSIWPLPVRSCSVVPDQPVTVSGE